MPNSPLRDFDQHYQLAESIGSGAFGSVSVAVEATTGTKFAVKVIKKQFLGELLEPRLARCDSRSED